jgi:hypothetical protein
MCYALPWKFEVSLPSKPKSKFMWRGENPIEDFERIMSLFLWSLLSQQVDSILADMKESSASAKVKALGPANKRQRLERGVDSR